MMAAIGPTMTTAGGATVAIMAGAIIAIAGGPGAITTACGAATRFLDDAPA
jgi:hypothetical protein